MSNVMHSTGNGLNADLRSIDSIYRMIVVAGLRTKQLVKGGKPRILPDPARRRNISIALEEVRRGLVPFTINKKVEIPALLVKSTSPSNCGESVA